MTADWTPFPPDFAARYRARGYWLDRPLTRALDNGADRHPDRPAVIDGEHVWTYDGNAAAAAAMAARLGAAGLGPGDRAVVQLPNCAEFVIVMHALLRAGITPVNAVFSHRAAELTSYVRQLCPRLIVGDTGHELFANHRFLAALEAEGLAPAHVILRGATVPDRALDQWIAPGPQAPGSPTPPDEIAFFQLSGGSTGTPKLIPRTHNDYDYSIRESAAICGFGPETRFLCALPAAHNFTLSSPGILGTLYAGGTVVMAASPDPGLCWPLIARHRVDVSALVPSAMQLWLDHAAHHGAPTPLGHLLVGGAAFAPDLARRVPDGLGCCLQQVFGMAEGLVNYTRADDDPDTVFTTQGRPISPDDEVLVLDAGGVPVDDGSEGALAVRGPYTIRGYWKAEGPFDAEGFYHSGDLVLRRADGTMRVVGRIKDQINRAGEKIAAEEVEALLLTHPAIRAAALVAMPDVRLGECSVAVIVSEKSPPPSALRRHLDAAGLARYKLPDRFQTVPALPLTPIGKTDKRRLRAMLLAQTQEGTYP